LKKFGGGLGATSAVFLSLIFDAVSGFIGQKDLLTDL